ncbi:MAG: hypothetical protein AAB604_02380 [Patescibacteria group bacterium]
MDDYAAQLNMARNKNRQEEPEYIDTELSEEDIAELQINPPQEPIFPIFIFGLAVAKDLLDWAHGGFLGWLFAIMLGGIIWIWLLGKIGMVRKYLLRRLIFAGITLGITAFVPIVNVFIPEATIFVLLTHHREKEIVERFFKVLEQAERGLKYLKYV